ncbi:hypothetical protein RB653_002144 [Dictyostelium firmibasis]|uniref:Leucine-rich repeat-containing protein n=1 Tax=Dictyostelium firmibasis TaxID=79012 RepID=A0AAN7YMS0_9MYCE
MSELPPPKILIDSQELIPQLQNSPPKGGLSLSFDSNTEELSSINNKLHKSPPQTKPRRPSSPLAFIASAFHSPIKKISSKKNKGQQDGLSEFTLSPDSSDFEDTINDNETDHKENKDKEHKHKDKDHKEHKDKEHKDKEHKDKEHKDKEHKDKEHKEHRHHHIRRHKNVELNKAVDFNEYDETFTTNLGTIKKEKEKESKHGQLKKSLSRTFFKSEDKLNINNLPHTVITKILYYLIENKVDLEKSEIRFGGSPECENITSSTNGQLNMSGGSSGSDGGSPLATSFTNSLISSGSNNNNNNTGSKKNPNLELETICLVCKLWGCKLAPQVFTYFTVKSPKHLRSLIQLTTQGLVEGGKKFKFYYVAMNIDKSSTFQKFMNVVKHTMPDRLPEKFMKATTKPILSNSFSKNLFTQFFEVANSMTYFRFYQKWISPENFMAIGNALKTNTSITHLSFRHGNLDDDSIDAVINALSENTTIESIDFRGNKLGNGTAIKLAQLMASNKTSLKTIDFFYNHIAPEGGVALARAMKTNNKLEKLYLRLNYINGQTAIALGNSLAHNSTLKSVHLDHIDDQSGAVFFESLGKSTTTVLSELNLSNCQLEGSSASEISKTLSKKTSTLVEINFKSNKLGGSLLSIAKALEVNSTITRLNLSDNRIFDTSGGWELADALSNNRTITALSLSTNSLGNGFAEGIARALNTTTCSLKSLDISGNQIDYAGAKYIAEALSNNKTLKLLNMSQNKLSPQFGQLIADSLKVNRSLIHLELSYTSLGDKGSLPIASLLANDGTHLIRLNMNENDINDRVGIVFAESLATNTHIQVLDLSFNKLTYRSKEVFERSLKTNLSITNISFNLVPLKWKYQY